MLLISSRPFVLTWLQYGDQELSSGGAQHYDWYHAVCVRDMSLDCVHSSGSPPSSLARTVLHASCFMLHASRFTLHDACFMSPMFHASCFMSPMFHASCFMLHASNFKLHATDALRNRSFLGHFPPVYCNEVNQLKRQRE